jgi:hypothetical protein
MKILNQKAKINHGNLKQFIMRITSNELMALSEPCYYPKLKRNYFELLNLTGLTENDVKEYVKRFYYGLKAAEFQLQKDPIANLIIYIMYYFLVNNDVSAYATTMTYFVLRNYANLIHKQLKYCNPDAFKYALENIAKTHLFSREKTIANSLFFMAKEIMRRYTDGIIDGNAEEVAKMITETRTRVSQSIKSFAEIYYKAQELGTVFRNPHESEDEETGNKYQEQTQEKNQRIIETIAKKISVYRYIDKNSMMDAKAITKINLSIATILSNSIADIKYLDNIKIILKLFLKDIKDVKTLCGKEYYIYLRNLMSIKRTSSVIYFKQQISELVEKLIDDIKYREKYDSLSNQSKFMINLYIALYLTMILRNTIC